MTSIFEAVASGDLVVDVSFLFMCSVLALILLFALITHLVGRK